MKKFFGLLLKILPLLTIYKGLSSGGARLGPFIDTAKVALTQYEVAQITKLTYEDYAHKNKVVSSSEFPQFIKDRYHNQYSVLARELTGDKEHDHSKDIWGQDFQLILNQNIGQVRIASAGPDGIIQNKDDIGVDFPVEMPQARRPASVPKPQVNPEPQDMSVQDEESLEVAETQLEYDPQYDEEGFDKYGFNQDGYDRDGYDQNGFHRNEKELQYAEATTDQ